MFYDGCSDHVDETADTITSYIKFCEQNLIQTNTVRIFPNNKPCVTKELKGIRNETKHAFLNGNCTLVRGLNKEFRKKMKLVKLEYKNKVDWKLLSGNASDTWKGRNRMMGRTRKEQPLVSDNPAQFANDLNRFYARYDNIDYRDECDILSHTISSSPVTLVESDVVRCFSRIKPNKAPGPDGLRGCVMKVCADQLGPFLTRFFQLLLYTHSMPRSWKQSIIMPTAQTNARQRI